MEIHLSITRGHTVALFKILTLGLLLGFGIQMLFAWTAPQQAAPGGNVSGPITTGAPLQIKSGSLGLVGDLAIGALGAGKEICLNGDCIASWPAGGGSNVTEPIAWVHATASVKPGVEYQNLTGKRMMLLVKDTGGGDSRLYVRVYPAKPYNNTYPLFANSNESGGDLVSTTAIVPDGWYYYVHTITNGGPNYRVWTTAF